MIQVLPDDLRWLSLTRYSRMAKAKKKLAANDAEVDYASPEALRLYDFETQRRSAEIEQEISKAKREHEEAKATLARSRKAGEQAINDLREWTRTRNEGRGLPPAKHLFTDAEEADATKEMIADTFAVGQKGKANGSKSLKGIGGKDSRCEDKHAAKSKPAKRTAKPKTTARKKVKVQGEGSLPNAAGN